MKSYLHWVDKDLRYQSRYLMLEDDLEIHSEDGRLVCSVFCLQHAIKIIDGAEGREVVTEGNFCSFTQGNFHISPEDEPALIFMLWHPRRRAKKALTGCITNTLLLSLLENIVNMQDGVMKSAQETLSLVWEKSKNVSPSDGISREFQFKKSLMAFRWHSSFSKDQFLQGQIGRQHIKIKPAFESQVKCLFGLGKNVLMHQERMKWAWKLLIDHRQSIDQVSILLGYLNTRNFISSFKKFFGITPGMVQKINISHYF